MKSAHNENVGCGRFETAECFMSGKIKRKNADKTKTENW